MKLTLGPKATELWHKAQPGDALSKVHPTGAYFSLRKLHRDRPAPTQTANSGGVLCHYDSPRRLTPAESLRIQTFPDDFDFCGKRASYVCGMSVPPFMMQRVALSITRMLGGSVDIKPRTGPWKLADLKDVPKNGLKVFSCFACGGGSTMGYKLAGYEMLGCNEIDPEMNAIYVKNHSPRFNFLEPIQTFKNREDIPPELFDLDVLDGSPPCSSFSMAGNREKDWGKDKKFREGQAKQVLDELFFDFIDLANRLRPKVVVAENVKGLVMGAAKAYVRRIFEAFDAAGYDAQLFLLDASYMGVPQRRERTFFIARRKDLNLPKITIEANEPRITVGQAFAGIPEDSPSGRRKIPPVIEKLWHKVEPGKSFSTAHERKQLWSWIKLSKDKPSNTIAATMCLVHWKTPRLLNPAECVRLQTFPDDYDFLKQDAGYVCGMSVPPFMMQRIALAIARMLSPASA